MMTPEQPVMRSTSHLVPSAREIGGYVRASTMDRWHIKSRWAATWQLGMAAAGQIRLAVVSGMPAVTASTPRSSDPHRQGIR
jgi:hypothetical protein